MIRTIVSPIPTLAILLCIATCFAEIGNCAAAPGPFPGWGLRPPMSDDAKAWKWVSAPWLPSNRAYEDATREIDNLGSGPACASYRDEARAVVASDPTNRIAIYKWAYSTWKTTTKVEGFNKSRYPVEMALQSLAPPYDYRMARLRFLYIASDYGELRLLPLGEKLLQRDPTDYDVLLHFVPMLEGSYENNPNPATKQEMLSLAARIAAAKKDPVEVHRTMAGVYWTIWETDGHTKASGDRAIAEYRMYLKLAPKDAPFRANAELWIRNIEKGMP